jgi:hypothetical protein
MALNPCALYSAAEDCSRRGMVRLSFSNIPTRARGPMRAMGFAMISTRAKRYKEELFAPRRVSEAYHPVRGGTRGSRTK